jgi:uncharacterized protein (DUF1697 family)
VTAYVALLRGINVGGHNKVAMADLRRLFVELGHTDARTHIQSGNVLFSSRLGEAKLRATIEDALATSLGVPAKVVIRSAAELAAIVTSNPYLRAGAEPGDLYVALMASAPEPAAVAALRPPPGPDTLEVVGRDVFLHYPNGYGRSKLTNALIEKQLGVPATTRNWRVVTKLAELAAG